MSNPAKGSNAPLAWGTAREMNALEALMWRGEADPRLRSTICSFGVLDCAPEWERFLAACEWGTRMVPRFRQKVVEPAFGIGNPVWVNDPGLRPALSRAAAADQRGRWLARGTLVRRADRDDAVRPRALASRGGAIRGPAGRPRRDAAQDAPLGHRRDRRLPAVLEAPLAQARAQSEQAAALRAAAEWKTPQDVLREQLERDARQFVGNVREGAASLLARLQHPVTAVNDAIEFTSSLRRVLAEPAAEGSPLLKRRSLSWRFQAFDVSFPDLRAASKAASASLNDAFLAALLGAFRLYHEKLGTRSRRCRSRFRSRCGVRTIPRAATSSRVRASPRRSASPTRSRA
jgi:hypothetical protein